MAACRYLTHRMLSLPLTTERKKTEWQTILSIAKNNNLPSHLIEEMKKQIQNKTPKDKTNKNKKKWVTFTYHSPAVRKITNLFRHTDIKIAFKTTNTIQHQTRQKSHKTIPDYNKSGIYSLMCKTSNTAYIGQTSSNLALRYREHIRYIRNIDPQPAYTQYILQNLHEYGTLTDTMTLIKPIRHTTELIPFEQLFIQTYHHNGNLTDEQSAADTNPLFQLTFHTNLTSPPPQRSINTYLANQS